MNVHLVTTCTNRKKASVPLALCARNIPGAEQHLVQRAWSERISGAHSATHAVDLYCGRGFNEIKKTARALGEDFSIISAGLGLVPSCAYIPPYNLTISGDSEDNVLNIIGKYRFSSSEWWTSVNISHNVDNPLANLISSKPSHIFVLAISSSYWSLISNDLSNLSISDLARVRIVGLTGVRVPPWAQDCLLAYDSRFDGHNSPLPGTRSDFPQRACAHYVSSVLPSCGLIGDKDYVRDLMNGMQSLPPVIRRRLTDEELIEVMRNGISCGQSTGAQILRWLRDVEMVACEQGRCAKLYKIAVGRI